MDKLKLYAAPIVALVLILVWYFVVQPKLAVEPQPAPSTKQSGKSDAKGP